MGKKPVKSKSKTSSVKQKNRLRNKGKLKTKRNSRKTTLQPSNPKMESQVKEVEPSNGEIADDVMDMLSDEELEYLRESSHKKHRTKIEKEESDMLLDDGEDIEDRYERLDRGFHEYSKMMLPIKTKEGIERRFMDVDDQPERVKECDTLFKKNAKIEWRGAKPNGFDEDMTWKPTFIKDISQSGQPLSEAQLLAKREEIVNSYKFRIGLLSTAVLENPEEKIGNLSFLLDIMGSREAELQITVKKYATLSLMEIFKDLLPAYQIKHQETPFNKLKKITKQLVGYEAQLLKAYKNFLVKLEKLANNLRKKKGDKRIVTKPQKGLGLMAVQCLSELLSAHSYFNYAPNIVQLLTPFLDNPDEGVRKIVEECYKKLFKEDKRGNISLTIVRRINHLVKSRAHSVHCEVLKVLLALRIKEVNLDQEKEDEILSKKLQAKKQRILSMSKRERKKQKELKKLDNEMLEVKAEESKKNKAIQLTEITKMVFLIYFRILKTAPRSNLLTTTLEGLAKFSHCINLEYYQDLMNILNQLLDKEELKLREQIYCIKTIFTILSGPGDVLNIDPIRFYSYVYKLLLSINAGKDHEELKTLLPTLESILIKRHKKVTTQRMLSFTKRLATMCLQLHHNGTLGILAILKSIVQLTSSVDLLLDVESCYGQGVYNAELNEPEYANAGNTSMWELCALQRHYHPTVRKMSHYIAEGAPVMGQGAIKDEFAKQSSEELFELYDPSAVSFKPSIPSKLKSNVKKNNYFNSLIVSDLINNSKNVLDDIPNTTQFGICVKE